MNKNVLTFPYVNMKFQIVNITDSYYHLKFQCLSKMFALIHHALEKYVLYFFFKCRNIHIFLVWVYYFVFTFNHFPLSEHCMACAL